MSQRVHKQHQQQEADTIAKQELELSQKLRTYTAEEIEQARKLAFSGPACQSPSPGNFPKPQARTLAQFQTQSQSHSHPHPHRQRSRKESRDPFEVVLLGKLAEREQQNAKSAHNVATMVQRRPRPRESSEQFVPTSDWQLELEATPQRRTRLGCSQFQAYEANIQAGLYRVRVRGSKSPAKPDAKKSHKNKPGSEVCSTSESRGGGHKPGFTSPYPGTSLSQKWHHSIALSVDKDGRNCSQGSAPAPNVAMTVAKTQISTKPKDKFKHNVSTNGNTNTNTKLKLKLKPKMKMKMKTKKNENMNMKIQINRKQKLNASANGNPTAHRKEKSRGARRSQCGSKEETVSPHSLNCASLLHYLKECDTRHNFYVTRSEFLQSKRAEPATQKKVFVDAHNSYIRNLNISPEVLSGYDESERSHSGSQPRRNPGQGNSRGFEESCELKRVQAAQAIAAMLERKGQSELGEQLESDLTVHESTGETAMRLQAHRLAFEQVISADGCFAPVLTKIKGCYESYILNMQKCQQRAQDMIAKAKEKNETAQARIRTLEKQFHTQEQRIHTQANMIKELKGMIAGMLKGSDHVFCYNTNAECFKAPVVTPAHDTKERAKRNSPLGKTAGFAIPPLDLSKLHRDQDEDLQAKKQPPNKARPQNSSLLYMQEEDDTNNVDQEVICANSSRSSQDSQDRVQKQLPRPANKVRVPALNMGGLKESRPAPNPLDLTGPKVPHPQDYHDEFMAKANEFSRSWREALAKEKRY